MSASNYEDEEKTPDALLGSESQVKKKRLAKKIFEEVCNVACLEKFRLNQNIIQFLQQLKIERIEQSHKIESLTSLEKTFKEQLWILLNEQRKIDANENTAQIKALKEKLDELSTKLQAKIENITTVILQLNSKIDEIKKELSDIHNQYAVSISALFKEKVKLNNIQLNLVIPPNLQKLLAGGNLPTPIELGANFNVLLITKLCEEFKNGKAKISQTEDILTRLAEDMLRDKLDGLPELAHLDKPLRDQVITELLNLPEVKSEMKGLVRDITNNIFADNTIIQIVNSALNKEHELSYLSACKDVCVADLASFQEQHQKVVNISASTSNIEQFTPAALATLDAAATSSLSTASENLFDFSSMSFESVSKISKTAQTDLDSVVESTRALADTPDKLMTAIDDIKTQISDISEKSDQSLVQAMVSSTQTAPALSASEKPKADEDSRSSFRP